LNNVTVITADVIGSKTIDEFEKGLRDKLQDYKHKGLLIGEHEIQIRNLRRCPV